MPPEADGDTWRKAYETSKLRKERFERSSGEAEPLYVPSDEVAYQSDIGYPGFYPFVRGIYPTMYRGRLRASSKVRQTYSPRIPSIRRMLP